MQSILIRNSSVDLTLCGNRTSSVASQRLNVMLRAESHTDYCKYFVIYFILSCLCVGFWLAHYANHKQIHTGKYCTHKKFELQKNIYLLCILFVVLLEPERRVHPRARRWKDLTVSKLKILLHQRLIDCVGSSECLIGHQVCNGVGLAQTYTWMNDEWISIYLKNLVT